MPTEHKLAVYLDVDNAFPRFGHESLRQLFDRLASIGTVHVCRAYADWNALGVRTQETMRWAVTPVHLYTRGVQRKNAADIAVAVDAMEAMSLSPELDTFVLVTGDIDLAPLATRLKERGKTVLGFGRRASASSFLVRACNRFEYLEDLAPKKEEPQKQRQAQPKAEPRNGARGERNRAPASLDEVRGAMVKVLNALGCGSGESVQAGGLKSELLEVLPQFREKDFGAKTFVAFLDAHAAELGLRVARRSSGTVRVARAEEEPTEDERDGGGDSVTMLDLEDARDLLERAIDALDTGGPVHLGGLKETMLRMSPAFSERALGYRRFWDFVRGQNDMVEMAETAPNEWGVSMVAER
jgi:hypothetical protein